MHKIKERNLLTIVPYLSASSVWCCRSTVTKPSLYTVITAWLQGTNIVFANQHTIYHLSHHW